MKIRSPVNGSGNNVATQNGEEWTEISLNNSPDEIYYNNDVYSDEEDQIPYKPLPMDLSPETAQPIGTTTADPTKEQTGRKRLITQKSLPTMSKVNEVSLSEEKKAEVTRSPSVKNRGKLDSSIASWITRSSAAGEVSGGSSSECIRIFLKYFVFSLRRARFKRVHAIFLQRIRVDDNLSTCCGAAVRGSESRNYSITV